MHCLIGDNIFCNDMTKPNRVLDNSIICSISNDFYSCLKTSKVYSLLFAWQFIISRSTPARIQEWLTLCLNLNYLSETILKALETCSRKWTFEKKSCRDLKVSMCILSSSARFLSPLKDFGVLIKHKWRKLIPRHSNNSLYIMKE